jgi:hypothetical protein
MRNLAFAINSNLNDSESAIVASAMLRLTLMQDEQDEDVLSDQFTDGFMEILEKYCPVFRVPDEILTPAEHEAIGALHDAIFAKACEMVTKLQASKDPLIQALCARQTAQ